MRTIIKYATAVTLTGALAVAMATPSQARHWHGGAVIGGFAAGALIGAAATSGYYGGPGYYYGPDYAYAPGPYVYGEDAYAYEPAPYARSYSYDGGSSCAGDLGYGRPDYSSC
jgi:hypothetical protein